MANGFFTDTTLCIGCKACEVACKQWNELPSDGFEFTGMSYDNTSALSGTTWRHVAFVENVQIDPEGRIRPMVDDERCMQALHACGLPGGVSDGRDHPQRIRRGFHSARRMQRMRLLRALMPIRRRGRHRSPQYGRCIQHGDVARRSAGIGQTAVQARGGVAGKCTLCYDRQRDGFVPACAKACPTESIAFGNVEELKTRARKRVAVLQERGVPASLYGVDSTSSVGDLNAFFLLTDRPEAYNLPSRPVLPSTRQPAGYGAAALTAFTLFAFGLAIFGKKG